MKMLYERIGEAFGLVGRVDQPDGSHRDVRRVVDSGLLFDNLQGLAAPIGKVEVSPEDLVTEEVQ